MITEQRTKIRAARTLFVRYPVPMFYELGKAQSNSFQHKLGNPRPRNRFELNERERREHTEN